MILVIAIGVLTTMLGVAFGCTVLELTMRAIRHSMGDMTDNALRTIGSLGVAEIRGPIAERLIEKKGGWRCCGHFS